MHRLDLIQRMAEAIAINEGFMEPQRPGDTEFHPRPTTLAYRHNNPGNIRLWGKYPRVKGYVVFPNVTVGWQALYKQIDKNINRGLTLREFFAGKPGVYFGYAPSVDGNQPVRYAEFVSRYLRGFSATVQGVDQVIKDLITNVTKLYDE